MKFIYAYRGNKKTKEFDVPVYRDGAWWAIGGYKVSQYVANFFWEIGQWFLQRTCEHEALTSNTTNRVVKCADCGRTVAHPT